MKVKSTTAAPFSFASKDERDFWRAIVQDQLSACLKLVNGKSAQGCAQLAAEIADAAVSEYRRRVK